ncbi:MAG: carboxypeptidase regulatory-like domain-containing protein [Acidobacteria bacterium]|nr:carboxypeptidase regulatory-like domain-containing protein [Acidobacteriota bacterium]
MKKQTCRPFILLFAFALCVVWAGAQNVGTISGTVSDETGAVLPGSTVEVVNLDTGATRVVVTDDEGRFRARDVGLGTYRVSATLPGFQTVAQTGIVLTIGREAVIELELPIGEISELVEVTSDAALIETTSSSLASLVDRRQISDLPLNSRDFSSLILLSAGTTKFRTNEGSADTGFGARISVSGARPSASSFSLDGTDITTALGLLPAGVSGSQLGIEAMREFKVLTSNYSAAEGRMGGASIIAVSRSGTNAFHGSLYEYHRNDNLDARDFFLKGPLPEFKQNQFGFSLGGPITQDRLFFFGTYEGLRQTRPLSLRGDVPIQAIRDGIHPDGFTFDDAVFPYFDLWPLPNGPEVEPGISAEFTRSDIRAIDQDYFAIRMDYMLGDNHSFFGRYTFDDSGRLDPRAFELFIGKVENRNQYVTLEGRSVLSPRLLNVARIGFARSNLFSDLLDGPRVPDTSLNFVGGGRPFGSITGLGDVSSLSGFGATNRRQINTNTFQFYEDVTYDMGNHSLKFGAQTTMHVFNYWNFGRWGALWDYNNFEDFLQNNEPDRFRLAQFSADPIRTYLQWVHNAYIQDDFQIRPNLTLNLGLRYVWAGLPSERYGRMSNLIGFRDPEATVGPDIYKNPSGDDFAPRVGLAWDPTGSGKYSVRSGFGVFHDPLIIKQTFNVVGRVTPFWAEIDQRNFGAGKFPNVDSILEEISQGPAGIHFFESEPSSPYMMQWSLSLQGLLMHNLVLETAYAGSKGVHLSSRTSLDIGEPQFCGETRDVGGIISTQAPADVCAGKAVGTTFYPADAQFINPQFTRLFAYGTGSASTYHAWKNTLTKRLSGGLQFQGAYTWSKTLDENSAVISGELGSTSNMDPWNMELDWGLSDMHVAHTLVTNFTYDLPIGQGKALAQNASGVVEGLLGGWQMAGIFTFATGTPVNASGRRQTVQSLARSNRAQLVPGADNNPTSGGVQCGEKDCRMFDPEGIFVQNEPGFYGNVGRNTMIGPGLQIMDISLLKNTYFGSDSSTKVQFRAEFFNFLNHPSFARPSGTIFTSRGRFSSNVGRIQSTVSGGRQIQLALRIEF